MAHGLLRWSPGGLEARGDTVDMQVKPGGLTLGAMAEPLSDTRIDQLMRWHGTDETNLPPAHTLQNLSRDTIAALGELRRARENIAELRAAMGRAFWATDFRELHDILLTALGPPPDDDAPTDTPAGTPARSHEPSRHGASDLGVSGHGAPGHGASSHGASGQGAAGRVSSGQDLPGRRSAGRASTPPR